MSEIKKIEKGLSYWNRKIHIHIGLFLVLFICLFSFSGLLLNHGSWKISDFWKKRKETNTTSIIQIPEERNSTKLIQNILSQLDFKGEVNNIKMWPDSIHFRVSIPGDVRNFSVNLNNGRCVQDKLKFNLAGTIRTLHTFNGMDRNNDSQRPNWLITKIWRYSMHGIAAGLIMLSLSSWLMWFKVRQKFAYSLHVLITGLGIAIYFVFILRIF